MTPSGRQVHKHVTNQIFLQYHHIQWYNSILSHHILETLHILVFWLFWLVNDSYFLQCLSSLFEYYNTDVQMTLQVQPAC